MRLASTILLAIGLGAAAWSAPRPAAPQFAELALPNAAPEKGAANLRIGAPLAVNAAFPVRTELPQDLPSAHASSLAFTADGGVLVAWFAGTREGASDVRIEMAQIDAGKPLARWTALTRQQLESGVRRSIRKLGNPMLCRSGDGRLHLFVVSVSVGGWSGSAINHLTSTDDGRTWSPPRRLILSPLLNLSSLVRAPALSLLDGGLGLPAYHECITKWPLWTRLDRDGQVASSIRMPQRGPSLQPAVAALSPESALAVLRRGQGSVPRVLACATADGGSSWIAAPDTGVPNPDSGVALVRLAEGTLLMACNPLESGRDVLQFHYSRDGGGTWVPGATVERASSSQEFSYPTLLADGKDAVILSYTLNRKAIVVRRFSAASAMEASP